MKSTEQSFTFLMFNATKIKESPLLSVLWALSPESVVTIARILFSFCEGDRSQLNLCSSSCQVYLTGLQFRCDFI